MVQRGDLGLSCACNTLPSPVHKIIPRLSALEIESLCRRAVYLVPLLRLHLVSRATDAATTCSVCTGPFASTTMGTRAFAAADAAGTAATTSAAAVATSAAARLTIATARLPLGPWHRRGRRVACGLQKVVQSGLGQLAVHVVPLPGVLLLRATLALPTTSSAAAAHALPIAALAAATTSAVTAAAIATTSAATATAATAGLRQGRRVRNRDRGRGGGSAHLRRRGQGRRVAGRRDGHPAL